MMICNVCDEEDENVEIYFEADSKGRGLVRIGVKDKNFIFKVL